MFLKIFLLLNEIIVFSESGLVGYGVTFRIGRIPVQTPLAARPGFGAQSRYKTAGDLRVGQLSNTLIIIIGLVRLSPRQWPKVGRGLTISI